MIKIEEVEVAGLKPALRGMRNPMNSWDRSDSEFSPIHPLLYEVGENDKELAMKLANGGPVHSKYRRMIVVWCDITAPLYWWKEFDTYKVGTVANSCSTMHKIHKKEFTLDDFSADQLTSTSLETLYFTIDQLNHSRNDYILNKNKNCWWQMIQLLPSSYNQKRTVMMSYEVLTNMYYWRKNHKLDEWRTFCEWVKTLPESYLITDCEVF